jgi:hypothetical protein
MQFLQNQLVTETYLKRILTGGKTQDDGITKI